MSSKSTAAQSPGQPPLFDLGDHFGWEVNFKRCRDTKNGRIYWARNPSSPRPCSRVWHWVKVEVLRSVGFSIPRADKTAWEVDWSHHGNTGQKVWARNPRGHTRNSRVWHWVSTGSLRACGINTPEYRKDSWEIDWSKRNGKLVWGRNQVSKMPKSRAWHWINFSTLVGTGVNWYPKKERMGRWIACDGYVHLNRRGMTDEEIDIANTHSLWRGERRAFCREHQLVAVKKYGAIPAGMVVRHLNGIKYDNSPDNLVLGTTQENTMDHNTARLQAMYWREQYQMLLGRLESQSA
jgi:hypothetical protein